MIQKTPRSVQLFAIWPPDFGFFFLSFFSLGVRELSVLSHVALQREKFFFPFLPPEMLPTSAPFCNCLLTELGRPYDLANFPIVEIACYPVWPFLMLALIGIFRGFAFCDAPGSVWHVPIVSRCIPDRPGEPPPDFRSG